MNLKLYLIITHDPLSAVTFCENSENIKPTIIPFMQLHHIYSVVLTQLHRNNMNCLRFEDGWEITESSGRLQNPKSNGKTYDSYFPI